MKASPGLRLLSVVALVLLAGLVVCGVVLALMNLGLALLYGLVAVGMFAGIFLLLVKTGEKSKQGLALSGVSLIGLVVLTIAFFREEGNSRWFWALVIFGIGYLVLAGAISQQYWKQRRAAAAPTERKARKPVLIVNPKSGGGRAIKADIPKIAAEKGIDVTVIEPGQDMIALARQAAEGGADVLGVSGGDGSLGAIAGIAIEHDLPLVVLPGGTRCHFAKDIGLDPARIVEALDGFEGEERRVDVGLMGDRVFLNNASFGLYAEIVSDERYRDHKLDVTTGTTRELMERPKPFYPLRYRDGGGKPHNHAAVIQVGVNRYNTATLGELGQRERMDEGVLHVIVVPALTDKVVRVLGTALPLVSAPPANVMAQWTTAKFKLADAGGRLKVGVDGESVEMDSPLEIRVLPKALRLLVPAAGARNRAVKPLSSKAAQTLWQLIRG